MLDLVTDTDLSVTRSGNGRLLHLSFRPFARVVVRCDGLEGGGEREWMDEPQHQMTDVSTKLATMTEEGLHG